MGKTSPNLKINLGKGIAASANGRFAIIALLVAFLIAQFGYLGGKAFGLW